MIKEKSFEGSSDGDRASFDFKYKIDISDRRGKTGETFKQESGFDFEDFKDFGDGKSQKSYITSQRKVLPSELAKRSEESFLITENATELSIKRKGGSFMGDEVVIGGAEISDQMDTDFAQYGQTAKDAQNSPVFKSSSQKINKSINNMLSRTYGDGFEYSESKMQHKSSLEATPNPTYVQTHNAQLPTPTNQKHLSYNVSSSRQKQNMLSPRLPLDIEYKDILASIQFYENESLKLEYEKIKMIEEIQRYQEIITNREDSEEELDKITEDTNLLNSMITNQRGLEKTLLQNKARLEEEFDQVVVSIESMKFGRPQIIKDETKAILDEINTLKSEFDNFRRDEGSLNLSATLQNTLVAPSIENRFSFIPQNGALFNPEENIMGQFRNEIVKHSKNEPNYIYNIKMLIVKDEHKIYENAEIVLSCSTRDYPNIELKIGNKTSRNLTDFYLKESDTIIVERENLQGKNYYTHSYRMVVRSQPFLKIEIGYRATSVINGEEIPYSFVFFIPLLPLKHGEFLPITQKEYQKEFERHRDVLDLTLSSETPIDSLIINSSLSEALIYYPNLIEIQSQQELTYAGIFRLWNSNEGALITLKQNKNGNSISIEQRGTVSYLLHGLQFLFGSVM